MSTEEPVFRVVRGTPTAEELAALVGVLTVRSRPAGPTAPPAPSAWARSGRPGSSPLVGPNGWRTSGLPR